MAEYIDALITCELAMLMACKHKEPVDEAVRKCAFIVANKCTNWNNRMVFIGVSKSELPSVVIYQFRTMLDEKISK